MEIRLPLLPAALRWGAVVAVAAFLFYFSLLTVPPATPVQSARPSIIPLDKWRHFVGYAVLGLAIAYAIADWDLRPPWAAAMAVAVVVIYGVGIELGQASLPERYFSLLDATANAAGGFVVTPWFLLRRRMTFVSVETWLRGLAGEPGER